MNHYAYLICLLTGLGGLAIFDRQYKLALWADHWRALKTVGVLFGVTFLWDLIGIAFGIFAHGNGKYNLAFEILPDFPPEEIVFLALFSYLSLLIYRGIDYICSRTS